jgi:aspartyl-tRNA synthetase
MAGVFEAFADGKPVTKAGEFPRIPYAEAMLKYGSDKPDLRNPIEMQIVSEHFAGSGFKIFAGIVEKGGEVRAIPAPTGGSRAFCDRMNSWAQKEGLPGMGYIFWREEGGQTEGAGPLAKNIGPERTEALRAQLGLKAGDAAFFLAGDPAKFVDVAGKARNVIGAELGLTAQNRFDFCWIVDFPMYEWDDEHQRLDFSHNPFSMPQGGLEALETLDPLHVLGFQYDIVCNGVELSSGAIRNHKPEIMFKAFEIAGYSRETVEARFGGMLNAFRFGAPPHGGIAPGIDRIVMLLAQAENIREVIMFPMNQKAEDLMMGAPSEPSNEQLRELGLRVIPRD